mgnify:FL=1
MEPGTDTGARTAKGGIMETAEEVKELIKKRISELTDSSWVCIELKHLLKAIDAPPPCEHIKAIGSMRHPTAGWMPFRAYVDDEWKSSEVVFDKFKFCPYCGEKLNV